MPTIITNQHIQFSDNTNQYNLSPAIGSIIMWGGTTTNIPTGYLLCDGKPYSSASTDKYYRLFNVLEYRYGITYEGSVAKFNLPDLNNRIPIGSMDENGNKINVDETATETGGTDQLTLSHLEHGHTFDREGFLSDIYKSGSVGDSGDSTSQGPTKVTSLTTNYNDGSGSSTKFYPPYIPTLFIIRYA